MNEPLEKKVDEARMLVMAKDLQNDGIPIRVILKYTGLSLDDLCAEGLIPDLKKK